MGSLALGGKACVMVVLLSRDLGRIICSQELRDISVWYGKRH